MSAEKAQLPSRGMPLWREKQRSLPLAEKVDLIGQMIQETRKLEAIKKACKPSATSLSNF